MRKRRKAHDDAAQNWGGVMVLYTHIPQRHRGHATRTQEAATVTTQVKPPL